MPAFPTIRQTVNQLPTPAFISSSLEEGLPLLPKISGLLRFASFDSLVPQGFLPDDPVQTSPSQGNGNGGMKRRGSTTESTSVREGGYRSI